MAVLKCKMCGGDLEISEGVTVCDCDYCGTKQTVPTAKDENLHGLYNRANTLRIKSEFDKAEQLYEKILQADETQAEAYWGLILCKYGIEYVEDPTTFKRIPTCHRTSFDSIISDEDYKSALKYADVVQKGVYEQEAKEIDRIQKETIELSSKEEPYDVFICYKETDESGKRTQDSVIANDIYHQLTAEGFKVFYAAITLEDKLGSAYEPCIFAALNSAKVMLAIGTKPEYFSAVWVKNEWSRFLKMMKNDRSKMLIPCYKDMDAYELPEEFAHLQAQDMSKIGFINDVVRGIKKVAAKSEEPKTIIKETTVTSSNNIEPLLERAFMFLEDKNWQSANEYFEKVLDQDPKNAQAYLGKLLAELRCDKKEHLKDCHEPFDNKNNYQKTLRFADESLKNELEQYIKYINTRNEETRLNNAYDAAVSCMNDADSEEEYEFAAEKFNVISSFKDSAEKAKECFEKAEITRKDTIYAEATEYQLKDTIEDLEQAITCYQEISAWKDSNKQIDACKNRIEDIKNSLEKERIEKEEQDTKAAQKRKLLITIFSAFACVVVVFVIVLTTVIIPNSKYNKAIGLIETKKYEEAYDILVNLGDYKDSNEKLNDFLVLFEEETIHTDESNLRYKYKYDSTGKVIEMASYIDGTNHSVINYSYDSKGNCIKETWYTGEVAEYKYDSSGNCIEYSYTDKDFEKNNRVTKYKYDINGNCIEEIDIDYKGEEDITNYTYDSKGNCIKKVDRFDTIEYTYDSKGNCTKKTDDNGHVTEYAYDSNDRCIKKTEMHKETAYEYDAYGNITKALAVYTGGNTDTYEYQYKNRKVFYARNQENHEKNSFVFD